MAKLREYYRHIHSTEKTSAGSSILISDLPQMQCRSGEAHEVANGMVPLCDKWLLAAVSV
jgi:hypothetical protein